MRKQILFNFSHGQWAISLANTEEILHSAVNFPHLEKFEWFEIVRSNFFILKEYFDTLIKPKNTVSDITDIVSAPSRMMSARLGVNLTPLLKLWKSSLLLSCSECKTQQFKCPCLVTGVECVSENIERHSRECSICGLQMEGAHVLELDFFDQQNKTIKVEFSPELMDCFLSGFSALTVLTKVNYVDFIQTLSWHAERYAIGCPFIQSIILRKVISSSGERYIYISGVLRPTANGDRCVSCSNISRMFLE